MLHTPSASPAPLDAQSGDVPRLPQSEPRDFFLFTVSRKDLAVDTDGFLVAVPCKLIARPGLQGTTFYARSARINHDGAILLHQRAGRSVVPDDFPVVSFGRQVAPRDSAGRPTCTYRAEHKPTAGGPQYHDVWNRWRLDVDGEWTCEVDADGYMQFLRQLAAWLAPEEHRIQAVVDQEHRSGRDVKRDTLKIWTPDRGEE